MLSRYERNKVAKRTSTDMRWIIAVMLTLFVAASARADWDVRRDPFDPVVIRRYKEILAKDPHDEGILRALVALYKGYRTIAKLDAEYRARLDTGEDWATLVVLARLPRTSRAESSALWKRALVAKPDDASGWLAAGDATVTEPGAARDMYKHAVALVTDPRRKRVALTKLIGAARLVGDGPTVDTAFAELIALSPKDGMLWLDRGNSQLATKQFEAAALSFATAEPLLETYPEQRLLAMMNRGIALDGLGRSDAAILELVRTLDQVPRGYYLGEELVLRIIDVERRRKTTIAAIERLERRWPEKTRGYFEWATLGDLYTETHDEPRSLAAYEHAVAKAPTEVGTQRKMIALLDKLRPEDALPRHEAAAKIAPGDVELQVGLARRYYPLQADKAFATLDALARRMRGSVNAHTKIAELYEEWNQPGRAIPAYETIAALEPDDPDHSIILGEAQWRAGNKDKALAAWDRLDTIKTSTAFRRHGEELALHDVWDDAIAAYTRSLALDGTNIDSWNGRARAHDALGKYPEAIGDARRAVALIGFATHSDGMRNRELLVRTLGHAYGKGEREDLDKALTRWRFAFQHGDVTAGYLLAAHHSRIRSNQLHDVLVELYRLVPADDSLGVALSRSFEHRGDFVRARHELEKIAQRSPAKFDEMTKLISLLDTDRERFEREFRWEEEGRSKGHAGKPDLVGRPHRAGIRLELGADVNQASGALFGFGLYTTVRKARGVALAYRLDLTKRNDKLEELDTFAFAGSITARVLDARKFEVALAAGPRFELRYNRGPETPWPRVALAGDLAIELLPRKTPATLGLRFAQVLTDHAKSSAMFLELGFELR